MPTIKKKRIKVGTQGLPPVHLPCSVSGCKNLFIKRFVGQKKGNCDRCNDERKRLRDLHESDRTRTGKKDSLSPENREIVESRIEEMARRLEKGLPLTPSKRTLVYGR